MAEIHLTGRLAYAESEPRRRDIDLLEYNNAIAAICRKCTLNECLLDTMERCPIFDKKEAELKAELKKIRAKKHKKFKKKRL